MFSPLKNTREIRNLEYGDGEQNIMKKYLNESEKVLKIIVKKLVLILNDLKIALKFPRKNEYKESSN